MNHLMLLFIIITLNHAKMKLCSIDKCKTTKNVKKINNLYYCTKHINYLNTCFCCVETYTNPIYYCSSKNTSHSICEKCLTTYVHTNFFRFKHQKLNLNKCSHSTCSGVYNMERMKNNILCKYLVEENDVKVQNIILIDSFEKTVQETLTKNRIRICKHCETKIIRLDACNFITCVCGNTICYACGNDTGGPHRCHNCSNGTYTNESVIENMSIEKSYNELISIFGEKKKKDILKEIKTVHKNFKFNKKDNTNNNIIFSIIILAAIAWLIIIYGVYGIMGHAISASIIILIIIILFLVLVLLYLQQLHGL
jgi:hypothetical protein